MGLELNSKLVKIDKYFFYFAGMSVTFAINGTLFFIFLYDDFFVVFKLLSLFFSVPLIFFVLIRHFYAFSKEIERFRQGLEEKREEMSEAQYKMGILMLEFLFENRKCFIVEEYLEDLVFI